MTTEQLEGYLRRLGLKYRVANDQGEDGLIHVGFSTQWYRCVLPPRSKHLKMQVMLTNSGGLLTIAAPFVYHMRQAKRPAAFHEYLMALNYEVLHAQFQLDRRDGEVRCCAHVPVAGSNLSIEAFRKLLYSIPMVVDVNHRQTASVLRTGKLPPAPKPPEFYTRLLEELMQRTGSVENLRKIVEEHEASAKNSARKREEEICNTLPDNPTIQDITPPADAVTDAALPKGKLPNVEAVEAPGEKPSLSDSAPDAAPPASNAGPDQPLT